MVSTATVTIYKSVSVSVSPLPPVSVIVYPHCPLYLYLQCSLYTGHSGLCWVQSPGWLGAGNRGPDTEKIPAPCESAAATRHTPDTGPAALHTPTLGP